eukprot:scaffold65677_cov62-Phaeocystis_antarctica.AAC.1
MLCPNSCARTGALDERMSDQHAPARADVAHGGRQEDLDVRVPRGRVACGVRCGPHVLDDGIIASRVAGPVRAGRLVHVDVDHLAHADRDQVLLREGVGRDQLPPPRTLVSGDSGDDELDLFDFHRVRVGGGELRPHGPRVPDRVERLPLVALGFDNEREPVSGREPLVVVCPRQGLNA